MSDDQHVDHVEYADSDGEIPNKESVISNQEKPHEFQPNTADEKGELQVNNSEAITQLTYNNVVEEKLEQQPQEHVNAETNYQEDMHEQKQQVNQETEYTKNTVELKEQQEVSQVQQKQEQKVEQIKNIQSDVNHDQDVNKVEPANSQIVENMESLKSEVGNSLNINTLPVQELNQSKKQAADNEFSKQALEKNLTNKSQQPQLQNQQQEQAQNDRLVDQNQNLIAQNKEEKPVEQANKNETNSILDRAIYEQHLSDVRMAELESEIKQQPKPVEQHKHQPKPVEIQKQTLPVQQKKVNEKQEVQATELNKMEKVDPQQNHNNLSLSQQKIQIEHRGTKQLKEMIPRAVNARNNAPPKLQQSAGQNPKACKCEVM